MKHNDVLLDPRSVQDLRGEIRRLAGFLHAGMGVL